MSSLRPGALARPPHARPGPTAASGLELPGVQRDQGVPRSIPGSHIPFLGGLQRGAVEAPGGFAACLPANPKSPCLTPSQCGAHVPPTRPGFGPAGATSCSGRIRDGGEPPPPLGWGQAWGRGWEVLGTAALQSPSPSGVAGCSWGAPGITPPAPWHRGWHPAHAGTWLSHPTGLVGHPPWPHRLTRGSRPLGSCRWLRSNFATS